MFRLHKHVYGVPFMEHLEKWSKFWASAEPVTAITDRCIECGKVRQQIVNGHITPDGVVAMCKRG